MFSAAAASLRARQPEPEVTLVGTVVGLRRDDQLGTDTVTLSAYVGDGDRGRVRNVRLVIEDEEWHQIVSQAYQSRDAVTVSGDLQPSQGQLTVYPVTDVRLSHSARGDGSLAVWR